MQRSHHDDVDLLSKLLEDQRLKKVPRDAFEQMIEGCFAGKMMSPKQLAWARGLARDLGIEADEPPANLASNGLIKDPHARFLPLDLILEGPKPLKPPVRR